MIKDISMEDAIELFREKWPKQMETEKISISEAKDRVLAEDYYGRCDIPVVRCSMMDGIAVKSEYWKVGNPNTDEWEIGKEFVRADTGDDFPDDYDAVIPIEKVIIGPNGKGLKIIKKDPVQKGENIRGRGSSIQEGTPLVKKRVKLLPSDIGALAMGNISEVEVYKKPVVSFLPTGTELIPPGEEIKRGQNIDSNSLMAKGLLEEFGAEPRMYSISMDDFSSMEEKLEDALEHSDLILINGGSSKGEEDFGVRLLERKGTLHFHWTKAAPGRPCAMGEVKGKPVIIVPGPAYGCFNVLQWLVRPCIMQLSGNEEDEYYKVKAELLEDFEGGSSVHFLVGAEVKQNKEGKLFVQLMNFKRAGTYNCLMANGFVYTEIYGDPWKKGDILEITLIRPYIPLI